MKRVCLVSLYALVFCACDNSNSGGGGGAGGTPSLTYPLLDCDPLVPEYCGHPFPSNVYTVEDPDTVTGRRVRFGSGLLKGNDARPWDKSDGFSAGTPILTLLPGATGQGLASSGDVGASLDDNALTVVLDVETGEPVAHFAELDVRATTDEERSLIIRPIVRLKDDARYIVAVRGLVRVGGALIEPSAAFRALRDDEPTEEPSVEERRALYADIFTRLEAVGWSRGDLQIAWDFSTASDENNTSWLLHMRDDALATVPTAGPEYTVTQVDEDYQTDTIAFRIFGTMRAPLYMTSSETGSLLVFGDDGLPEINQAEPWTDVPFEILIPNSAIDDPAPLLQYGHGLLGEKEQVEAGHFRSFIDEYNYTFFATDLIGMADPDLPTIVQALGTGDIGGLQTMFDRLHQGFLNYLLLMRMMKTSFAADPTYGQYIDPDNAYYYGISQGGIMGAVYMALSTEVERGALGVMGQPYSVLLFRSVDFNQFLLVLEASYPDFRDQQLLIGLVQMLWDRAEPSGYAHHIDNVNRLPGTPSKAVLMRAALVDHQVPPLGGHIMARAVGAVHLDSGVRDIFGLEKVASTTSGSFYTEYDFGLPGVPNCNFPPEGVCADPHEWPRRRESARIQLDEFLRNGTGTVHCSDTEIDPPSVGPGICRYTVTDWTDQWGRLMNQCTPEDNQAKLDALCIPPDA